jgi:hypothetical protein
VIIYDFENFRKLPMTSIAILIANAHYREMDELECCLEDLAAVKSLLEAIGRFSDIRAVVDVEADGMRDVIRASLSSGGPYEEIFFYFSGHGAQIGSEFFYCGTRFDVGRPNETGLSHTDLHDMLRSADPSLLVKVVDACASGTLLIKADRRPPPLKKEGFRNVVQLTSCLDDQSSFGGDPLSEFTHSFCESCLRKTEGPIYYNDVINSLRDDFLENEDQTPHFVSQGTAREMLVDDAAKLASFRQQFETRWRKRLDSPSEGDVAEDTTDIVAAKPIGAKELLVAAEQQLVGPDEAKRFINSLFDGVLARFKGGEFADFFDAQTTEHRDFREQTARDFIIRVLYREDRPDKFVTAEIKRVKAKRNWWDSGISASLMMLNPEWTEDLDLELNCSLDRAQIRLSLTPKYRTLQQLNLVLTCAPSLERCYVFEIVTQHPRIDWEGFDQEGREIVRRWYKMGWTDDVSDLVEKICGALEDAVRQHIASTAERVRK